MGSFVLGSSSVSAREASAAMAMVTARTEANYHMVGFSSKLVPLNINSKMSLQTVINTIDKVSTIINTHFFCCSAIDLNNITNVVNPCSTLFYYY